MSNSSAADISRNKINETTSPTRIFWIYLKLVLSVIGRISAMMFLPISVPQLIHTLLVRNNLNIDDKVFVFLLFSFVSSLAYGCFHILNGYNTYALVAFLYSFFCFSVTMFGKDFIVKSLFSFVLQEPIERFKKEISQRS